jgi:LPXTG-motif cell wall-anchored protein
MIRSLNLARRAVLGALTVVALLATFVVVASPASAEVAPPGSLSPTSVYQGGQLTVDMGELACRDVGPAPSLYLYVGGSYIGLLPTGGGAQSFAVPGEAGDRLVYGVVPPDHGECGGTVVEYGTVSVFERSTTSTLAAQSAPFYADKPVTFEATVAGPIPGGGVPTGSFVFYSDGVALGAPVPVNTSGVAHATTTFPAVGSVSITAEFTGDGEWSSSTASHTHTVAPEPIAITIDDLAPVPAGYTRSMVGSLRSTYGSLAGYSMTSLTATLNGETVPLTVDTVPMNSKWISFGYWLSTWQLPAGTHSVTLTAPAQGNFAASSVTYDAVLAAEPTSITATAPAAPVEWGAPFDLAVQVPGRQYSMIEGTVNVYDADDDLVGSEELSGYEALNGTVPISGLDVGEDQVLRVEFTDSLHYAESSTTATVSVVPSPGTLDISVGGDHYAGAPTSVYFYVSHDAGNAAGSVELFADGVSVGTAAVDSSGEAIIDFTPPADLVTFDAVFTPTDPNYATVTSSTDTAFTVVDTWVEFDLTYVEPTSPDSTGSVSGGVCIRPAHVMFDQTLLDGADVAVTMTLDEEVIVAGDAPLEDLGDCWGLDLSGTNLTPGEYTITVAFPGSDYMAPETATRTFGVSQAPTEVALSVTDAGDTFGLATEFTATLSDPVPGHTQRGEIHFHVNGEYAGTSTVVDGAASFSTMLPAGTAEVSATYFGDGVHAVATSPSVVVDVDQAAASVAVSVAPNPVIAGQYAELRAAVTVDAPAASMVAPLRAGLAPAAATAAVVATGDVTFLVDGSPVGTATLVDGVAALPFTFVAGMHTVSASYSGSADVMAVSASASAEAVVTAVPAPDPVPLFPPPVAAPGVIVVPRMPVPQNPTGDAAAAYATGATGAARAADAAGAAGAAGTDRLPRTGSSTAALVLLGAALLGAGVVLSGRRPARR